jgi:TPR repeat protein
MKTVLPLAVALAWPLCAHADYFRGIDDLGRHDIPAAIRELTPLAEAGEADAEDALGVAYDQSNFTSGTTRARELFRKAAENGLLLGMWIPTHRGQAFRFDRGHHSDLKPATIPT